MSDVKTHKIWNFDLGSLIREDDLNGRHYIIVPMTMILEGVHAGSQGPVYYSLDELAKSPKQWNMKPIVIEHPFRGDTATDLEVYKKQAVGMIMNTHFIDGKLKAEAWIDVDLAKAKCPELLEHIAHRLPMEISTGLFSELVPDEGVWNGEPYKGRIINIRADHLAILPRKQGACSLSDGAGLLINQKKDMPDTLNIITTVVNQEYPAGSLVVEGIDDSESHNEHDAKIRKYPKDENKMTTETKPIEDQYQTQVFSTPDGYKITIEPPKNSFSGIPAPNLDMIPEKTSDSDEIEKVEIQDNPIIVDEGAETTYVDDDNEKEESDKFSDFVEKEVETISESDNISDLLKKLIVSIESLKEDKESKNTQNKPVEKKIQPIKPEKDKQVKKLDKSAESKKDDSTHNKRIKNQRLIKVMKLKNKRYGKKPVVFNLRSSKSNIQLRGVINNGEVKFYVPKNKYSDIKNRRLLYNARLFGSKNSDAANALIAQKRELRDFNVELATEINEGAAILADNLRYYGYKYVLSDYYPMDNAKAERIRLDFNQAIRQAAEAVDENNKPLYSREQIRALRSLQINAIKAAHYLEYAKQAEKQLQHQLSRRFGTIDGGPDQVAYENLVKLLDEINDADFDTTIKSAKVALGKNEVARKRNEAEEKGVPYTGPKAPQTPTTDTDRLLVSKKCLNGIKTQEQLDDFINKLNLGFKQYKSSGVAENFAVAVTMVATLCEEINERLFVMANNANYSEGDLDDYDYKASKLVGAFTKLKDKLDAYPVLEDYVSLADFENRINKELNSRDVNMKMYEQNKENSNE